MRTTNSPAVRHSAGRGRVVIAIGASAALGLVIVALCSCSTAASRPPQQLTVTGTPAMHAVSSERVRNIMQRIRYYPPVEYMDAPKERERQLEEIRQLAKEMAASANSLPATVNDLNLNPQEKEVFLNLAKKLANDATALSQVSHSSFSLVERKIDTVYSTCNACHALFRSER